MVGTYIKQSFSIKKEDEEEFKRFLEITKKDPIFIQENEAKSKRIDKKVVEFIGYSGVFTMLWKFYLRKKDKETKEENAKPNQTTH